MAKHSGLLALLHAKRSPPAIPTTSFEGKTVLITGSNTGLGFYAAQHFLRLGASRLILGVRSPEKGVVARAKLKEMYGMSNIAVLPLAMNSFNSVKAFADRVAEEYKSIDIAILNAGLFNMGYVQRGEGWEETIQVNTLATTLLALLLMPILRAAKDPDPASTPHLVLVSSGRHASVPPSSVPSPPHPILSHFNVSPTPATPFNGHRQYAISKLLLMYTLKPLARLGTTPGGKPEVIVTSCCPGFCASGLARGVAWYLQWAVWIFYKLFARTTEEGSRTLVSACALGPEAQGGYWKDDELMEPSEMLRSAEGKKIQEQVWKEIVDVLKAKVPQVERLAKEPA